MCLVTYQLAVELLRLLCIPPRFLRSINFSHRGLFLLVRDGWSVSHNSARQNGFVMELLLIMQTSWSLGAYNFNTETLDLFILRCFFISSMVPFWINKIQNHKCEFAEAKWNTWKKKNTEDDPNILQDGNPIEYGISPVYQICILKSRKRSSPT